MLNRNSKRFLSFLRRSTPDYDNRVISYEFIEENYDCSIQSVFATVRYLEKLGYIEIAKMNGHSFGVILTELALHPYEFSIAEIKDFLFRSVFTPVAGCFYITPASRYCQPIFATFFLFLLNYLLQI